jgi:hypothetical protein
MLDFYFHRLMTVQIQLTRPTSLILSSSTLHLLILGSYIHTLRKHLSHLFYLFINNQSSVVGTNSACDLKFL